MDICFAKCVSLLNLVVLFLSAYTPLLFEALLLYLPDWRQRPAACQIKFLRFSVKVQSLECEWCGEVLERGISRKGDRGSRIGDGRRSAATTRLIIKDIFLNGLGRTADNAHHITRSGRSDVFIFRGGVKRPTELWLWPACQRSDLMCCPGSADSRRCLPKTRRTDSWQTNNLGLRGIKTAMAEINKKGAECSQH